MIITIGKLNFKLRKANWKDYDYCYKLFKINMKSYIEKHWSWEPAKFRSYFNPSQVKILEYNNKRFGFYQTSIENGDYYLKEIHISDKFKGKGIGSKLLDIIHSEAKQGGYKKVLLQVFKDNPAKRLYTRLGYRITKDKEIFTLMEKKL
ncbi:MAG: GNAT family N-acetyltransferase [Actinobacteria bacterium]|nr:GNAT family N-acetyltransferase [Chloroflexota bacterium]MBE3128450.1 GNAT family N-acetyltransferase [Actinomycetota bacterium]